MAHINKCKHGKYLALCDECYPKTKLQQGWEEGYNKLNKQHKWANEIKAWADGAEIEVKDKTGEWVLVTMPSWNTDPNLNIEYRIKPTPKEPQYLYVYKNNKNIIELCDEYSGYTKDLYIGKIKLEQDDAE